MELLAPAGSYETLKSAVQSGADAVYIGGTEFSARRSASNFTLFEIEEAVKYCHIYGVKLHIAANILIKEKEKKKFIEYIGKLNDLGVDAVIIQDIGMAELIHKLYPDLPIHASTQMTVTNVKSALKLQEVGFSRIVLARELSKDAIKKICDRVDAEIEVFCHGAICMCYSGQCLLSSMIGGRSGNRGMCAQPCRLPYELDGQTKYYLSPKDMSLIEHLSELSEIGVTSLKIEGRLKRKEYVAAVCGIYKKYMESGEPVADTDKKELLAAFNRSGFTDGYFENHMGQCMMSLENPSNICENEFSEAVIKRCDKNANIRKIKVFISAKLCENEPINICIWDENGHFVSALGNKKAETAQNTAITKKRLEEQVLKLGNTPFLCEKIETQIENNITIPISEINEVRRSACDMFIKELQKKPKLRRFEYVSQNSVKKRTTPKLSAEVLTYEQAKILIANGIHRIYAPTEVANRLTKEFPKNEIVAKLPPVIRDDREYIKPETDYILISNIGQAEKSKHCFGDFRLNITNSESIRFYDNLESITLSPELNLKELWNIAPGNEVIGYGRIGLMLMENCPLKANGKCQNGTSEFVLRDRMKEKFPIICREGCVAELINSKPIYMADKINDILNLNVSGIRLVFTVETPDECEKICEDYKNAMAGGKIQKPFENTFTRGHFYRGVE